MIRACNLTVNKNHHMLWCMLQSCCLRLPVNCFNTLEKEHVVHLLFETFESGLSLLVLLNLLTISNTTNEICYRGVDSKSVLMTIIKGEISHVLRHLFFCSHFHRNSKFTEFKIFKRSFGLSPIMAHSKWEYVKKFELDDTLLPNSFAVARIDGRGFHKLAKKHNWTRPNDIRALNLMNRAAKCVMEEFEDAVLGYGQSDEYSFVFRRETEVFQRRSAKIITTLVAKFSSAFVYYWSNYFPDVPLQYPPSFDGRMVLYPTDRNLRDYLCWRQADCHINNLYNTTFWTLVLKGGMTNNDAQQRLSGTLSGDKNEILFSQFGINYNNEPEIFRKGTVLVKKPRAKRLPRKAYIKAKETDTSSHDDKQEDMEDYILEMYCDIIGDKFWIDYPHLLGIEQNIDVKTSKDAIKTS